MRHALRYSGLLTTLVRACWPIAGGPGLPMSRRPRSALASSASAVWAAGAPRFGSASARTLNSAQTETKCGDRGGSTVCMVA